MIRDILRTIGIACILTGTFLFFENTSMEPIKNDSSQQDLQIKDLEDKLSATQNELSKLQTATSVSQKNKTEKSDNENKIVEKESESETEVIIKTLFTIEPGTDSTSVGYELLRQGIINDNLDFETYLTTENLSGKIQIGEYELDSSMDIKTIVELITK